MLNYSIFFKTDTASFLRVVPLGKLYLPTGRLYCCDPFLSHEVNALEWEVRPGSFDVELCVAELPDWGPRVALARLLLSKQDPVAWREATFLIDDNRQSEFRVDAGLACFMDRQTRDLLVRTINEFHKEEKHNYYDDVLAAEFKQHANPSNPYDVGNWALHYPLQGDPRNIAMFASGLGDGLFTSYWGVDVEGRPSMLVADFDVLQSDALDVDE